MSGTARGSVGWRVVVVLIAVCAFGALPTSAQVAGIEEVNPDNSTLDPQDPDGASGGRVNGIVVDPNNASVLYAASEWGGIYKSVNAGLNWQRLDGHRPTATWDVAVDPSNSNRIYATSFFDGRKSTQTQSGINQSNNGGATWTQETLPPNGFCADPSDQTEFTAFGISIDPTDPSNVYVGTSCGLARTLDSGASWSFFKPPPGAKRMWDVLVSADGAFVDTCGDLGHWWMNTANGQWAQSSVNQLPSGRCSLAASPHSQFDLFAAVGVKIYESPDGAQWGEVRTNPSPQGRIPFVATNRRSGSGVFDLWFGDTSLHRVVCNQNVFPNFSCFSNPWLGPFTRSAGAHDDTGDIAFNPLASVDACPILMSSDGGVFYNTKSSSPSCHNPTWEQPNVTPHGLWPFSLSGANRAGTTAEDLYFGAQDNGVFGALDAGANKPTWEVDVCCDGFDTAADDFNGGSIIYSDCCYGGGGPSTLVFKKGAGFAGGGQLNNTAPGDIPGFKYPDFYALWGNLKYVMVTKGGSGGVYVTTNINSVPITWTKLTGGAAPPTTNLCGVYAGVAAGKPTFYAQVGDCNADFGAVSDQMYRYIANNTNGTGGSWTKLSLPSGAGFGIFAVNASDPTKLLAAGFSANDAKMYKSSNSGTSWSGMTNLDNLMRGNGDFPIRNFRGPTDFTGMNGYHQPSLVALDPTDPNIMVAGGRDSGVFLSTNAGTSWSLVTDPKNSNISGTPHIPRPRFAYFDKEGSAKTMFIASVGRGIWRFTLGSSCTANVTVANTTINGSQTFGASNQVTVGPNLTVAAAAKLTVEAGNVVVINNGTSIFGELVANAGGIPTCSGPVPVVPPLQEGRGRQ